MIQFELQNFAIFLIFRLPNRTLPHEKKKVSSSHLPIIELIKITTKLFVSVKQNPERNRSQIRIGNGFEVWVLQHRQHE